MNTVNLENLLTSYALGDLDAETARQVESHLAAHPESREILAEIQATLGLLREALARPLPAGLDKLESHRRTQVLELPPESSRPAGRAAAVPFFSQWLRMAATLAVTCGAAWLGIRHYLNRDGGAVDEQSYHAAKPSAPAGTADRKTENATADLDSAEALKRPAAENRAVLDDPGDRPTTGDKEKSVQEDEAKLRNAVAKATDATQTPLVSLTPPASAPPAPSAPAVAKGGRAQPSPEQPPAEVGGPFGTGEREEPASPIVASKSAGVALKSDHGHPRNMEKKESAPGESGPPDLSAGQSMPAPGKSGERLREDSRRNLEGQAAPALEGHIAPAPAETNERSDRPSQFSQESRREANARDFLAAASTDDLAILTMEQGNFQAFNAVGPRGGSYASLYPGLRARPGKIQPPGLADEDSAARSRQAKDANPATTSWCFGFTRPYANLPSSLESIRQAGNQGLDWIAHYPERWAASFDYALSGAQFGGMRCGIRKVETPLPRTSLLVILVDSGSEPVSATLRILLHPGAAGNARLIGYPNPEVLRVPGDHAPAGSLAVAVLELLDAAGDPPWGRLEVEWSTPGNATGREVLPLQNAGLGGEDALWAGATALVADALARKDAGQARTWTRVLAGHPRNLESSREAALVRALGALLAPAGADAEVQQTQPDRR